jgi:hypothetical protein
VSTDQSVDWTATSSPVTSAPASSVENQSWIGRPWSVSTVPVPVTVSASASGCACATTRLPPKRASISACAPATPSVSAARVKLPPAEAWSCCRSVSAVIIATQVSSSTSSCSS